MKMEPIPAATQPRSATCGDTGAEFHDQFGEEELLHRLISLPPENSTSSFTALLGLPSNQAMELLVHAPEESPDTAKPPPPLIFPSDAALVDRATKFSPLTNMDWVKQEPEESDSDPNSNTQNPKPSTKRKQIEKKGKECSKKSKKAVNDKTEEGGEKLPYVHVRARRGQATDSHSLAERARREKINARMKLLQELVPGCNKISGTAMVLDEIINHVQSLQRQVEFLSMRLAAVNPRIDFNLETLIAAESGSTAESNYHGMAMPSVWPEGHIHGNSQEFQQQWYLNGLHQPVWSREEENNSIFITPDNSLMSYDSSGNSVPLHSNQLKMEL